MQSTIVVPAELFSRHNSKYESIILTVVGTNIAIKITNKEVINARVLLERIFIFKKFPICPPIKTAKKNSQ